MPIPDYTEFLFDFINGDFCQGSVRVPYATAITSADKGRILRARPGQAAGTGCIPGRTVTIKEVVGSAVVLSSYIGAARTQGLKLEFVPFIQDNELDIYGDSLTESRFEFFSSSDKREAVNGQLQDYLGRAWRVRDYSRDGATSNECLNGGPGGNFNGAPFGTLAQRYALLTAGTLTGTRRFGMVAIGTNDIQTGVSFATYQSNVLSILAYLEPLYARIVIAGIPHRTQVGVVSDYETKRRDWNTWLESLCAGSPTRTFADLDRDDWRSTRTDGLGTIDGIHLSAHWAPYVFAQAYGRATEIALMKAEGAPLTALDIRTDMEREGGLLDVIRDRVLLSLPALAPGTTGGLSRVSDLPVVPPAQSLTAPLTAFLVGAGPRPGGGCGCKSKCGCGSSSEASLYHGDTRSYPLWLMSGAGALTSFPAGAVVEVWSDGASLGEANLTFTDSARLYGNAQLDSGFWGDTSPTGGLYQLRVLDNLGNLLAALDLIVRAAAEV
jgi:GDSL-like Lipase/Acylhydrolase family